MFYHVAKNKEDGRESRLSRSDGRQSRYDGDESVRRTPSTGRDGHGPDGEDLYDDDYYDAQIEPFIHVPKCMLGQPLKDFDSGQENTFVVVQKKFGKQSVYRFCTDKALFLLSTKNPIRRLTVYVATHQYFEILILLTIVTNCVFMALSDPPSVAEYVFAAIYTFEMIVKILAKGFILHKYAYLRNSWNWLDFLVVILGYITMSPKVDNLSGIRTFRVLRALKTISAVKGLKAMVNTLMKSMKMMTDVLILTAFFIAIFALIGLQMFLGKLRSRCVKLSANISAFDYHYSRNKDNWLYFDGSMEVICGNASTAWNCPSDYVCIEGVGDNPQDGFISYDDFLAAMLTSLQVCTLDFWESVYNSVLAAMGEPYMIYFLLAVFLGPFYLLNLVLAVVSASYEQEVNGTPDPELEREKMESIRRSASAYSFDGKSYVEFLHGPSPVVEIDGEKRYTVDNSPAKKKKKEEKVTVEDIKPPELGENPTCNIRIRVFMYEVVGSSWFEGFIIACILLNTVAMGAEHYDMSPQLSDVLEFCNYVFTAIFFVEMVCKLIALTFRGYARNRWNLFDGFLVMISLADLVLSKTKIVTGSTLSVLRVFRLMRVMKLAQSWKTMGDLISTIGSSIGALGNITVILVIIIYIFAVVGMQIFGSYYQGQVDSSGLPLRYNFRNFGNSFMMVFRILCGKWIEPQWQLMKLTNAASILFIFSVFVIGRWVVLNLFLALLLSSFGGDALSSGTSGEDLGEKKKSRIQRLIEWTKRRRKKSKKVEKAEEANEVRVLASSDSFGAPLATPEQDNISKNGKPFTQYQKNGSLPLAETNGAGGLKGVNNLIALNGDIDRRFSGSVDTDLALQANFDDNYSIDVLGVRENARGHSSSSVKIELHREKTYVDDCFPICCYSCGCCRTSYLESPPRRLWHNIRYYCKTLVENKYFEFLILFLIAFSSLTLVFEDVNLPERPSMKQFLEYCNYFFAIIFTLEFLVKLIGFGFIKYFTNLWNLLDVFIVAISLATLFGNNNLNALRSLRALRPLRAISRFEGMKVVVNSLVHSIPSIANVLLVCLVFWLIFSIMGYQLFGGQFSRCVDKTTNELVNTNIIDSKADCLKYPQNFSWVKRNINFDNSINGFLALFQTASLEGWFEVMADAYDARGLDKQPSYMVNYYTQLYFVIFIVLGAFFILNLFIGVIIDNFNRLKQQYEDGVGIFLTAGQRNWIHTLKSAAMKKPSRRLTTPTSKWRAALFEFVHTKYFEFFIMSVILVNMLTMMIQHHNQSKEVTLALKYLNFLFTGIFTIEAVLRLISMRLEYFKSGLNVFDFVIVVFSIAVIVLEEQNQNLLISPGLLRVVRVFRLGRLLRFFDGAKGIRKLLFTIVKSAPALVNIGTLLFLVMFIYAIMGMNLFSRVKKHGAITEVVNFETFGSSMCLLFRISTAAGWNGVLDAVMIEPPYCDKNFGNYQGGNCGDPILSIIYFVSYITLIVLIMINMYIAVILENFNQAQSQDEAGITEDDLDAYYLVWEAFDPKATQFIKYHQLPDFINSLEGPLCVPKPNYWFLEEHHIPIKDKHRIHCLDIMSALIKRAIGEVEGGETEDFKSVMLKVEDRFKATFPNRTKEATRQTTSERLKIENAAARKIQQVFRRHLLIHQMRQITNTKNMSIRARERNMEQIEHLVTVLWKAKREEKKSEREDSDLSDEDDHDNDARDLGHRNQTSEV